MDLAVFATFADAGTFLVADIFAAVRAGGNLWQALDIISLEKGRIPLKKTYQAIPYSDSHFAAFSKILVLLHKKSPAYDLGNHTL